MKARNRISVQQTQRLTLTATLATSIQILRADAQGLSRYLEEQAAENPALQLAPLVPPDWTPRWRTAFAQAGAARGEVPEAAAAAPSLTAHAMNLVEAIGFSRAEARIAEALVEELEPSGWIGQSPEIIAERLGVPKGDVDRVLARLQAQADPTGLFARNLADCLRLQAEDAEEMDAVMAAVLLRLPLVAQGEIDRLAREAGVSVEAVRLRIGRLRGYNPKPGAGFEVQSALVREPDLMVERQEDRWVVSLNRSALPTITVAEGRGTGRSQARAILRMIEGRNQTLLRVAEEILQRQEPALEQGLGALRPMTMADVAAAVGLTQSTVSRVVAGTAIDTPRGTWWLRALFTRALQDGGPSAGALRDRLVHLVQAEDPLAPLSDAALAQALSDMGAPVARRTVAKYRDMLKLPPAHRRRRRG
jgi:RNA polymerase sigma-54 factor